MRKQFNLQDWLADKSQQIETGECCPVRIVDCDVKPSKDAPRTILALVEQPTGEEQPTLYYSDGRLNMSGPSVKDLFIVTPEPELTEFEQALKSGTNIYVEQDRHMEDWDAKEDAKELLELARKEIEVDGKWYHDAYRAGYEKAKEEISPLTAYDVGYDTGKRDGKAEALKDLPRWKKETDFGRHFVAFGKVCHNGYTLDIEELYDKLPKDD